MFNWHIPWQSVFLLCFFVFARSNNETWQFSLGFFCVYCGRSDQSYSHISSIHSNAIIDCKQPYQIFCSSNEAIGCVKSLKIFDDHMEIIKDCLRLIDLSTRNPTCPSEYSSTNLQTFCCNDTPFCNLSISLFIQTSIWLFELSMILIISIE